MIVPPQGVFADVLEVHFTRNHDTETPFAGQLSISTAARSYYLASSKRTFSAILTSIKQGRGEALRP
jgi:hypothetical protein